jgi:hypothetical protein
VLATRDEVETLVAGVTYGDWSFGSGEIEVIDGGGFLIESSDLLLKTRDH